MLVQFDGLVDVETGAFSMVNLSRNAVAGTTFSLLVDGEGTTVQLDSDGLQGGAYEIGSESTDRFFAFYADSDGDRDVDAQDYGRFALTFMKQDGDVGFDAAMDFDGDGDVDGQDLGRLESRFLRSL